MKTSRPPPPARQRVVALLVAALAVPFTGALQCDPDYVGLPTPAQPYDAFVDRLAAFLQSDVGTGTILEENGNPIPPYFYSFAICDEAVPGLCAAPDKLFVASYPAFTAAIGIRAFLAHHAYSGDTDSRGRALQFADWVLSHRTPPSDVYGSFPYSTTANGVFGNLDPQVFPDGPSIELDKAAMFADSLLHLWEATGATAYFDAAAHIGSVLRSHQRGDGSLPWKVIPSSGATYVDYTSDQIPFDRLFRHLHALTGDAGYLAAASASFAWILGHPVATEDWHGFYEDVDDPASKVNFDALEVVRELIAHRTQNPSYMFHANNVFGWVERTFRLIGEPYAPLIPAIGEQTGFTIDGVMVGTASSTIQWAVAALDLSSVLGDVGLRTHAIEAVNVVNSAQQADGRTFTDIRDANGPPRAYPISWYEQAFIPLWMTLEAMAKLPSLAPTDENHLLAASGVVGTIGYTSQAVSFTTRVGGVAVLKLESPPSSVTSNGNAVPSVPDLSAVAQGYRWDAPNQLLTLKHTGTSLVVSLP